eukprot:GHRR01007020.1.p1 GENE.GHRR01007020.1~~GHRR01007020.1.p1  ORF type:complete len:531 (+),score=166.49 GHRR01007020.1:212-1804(+)
MPVPSSNLPLLAACVEDDSSNEQRGPEQLEAEVLRQFQDCWLACQTYQLLQQQIPQLHNPAPTPGSIKALVQQHARQRKLQSQVQLCLEEQELRFIGACLERHVIPGTVGAGAAAGIDPDEPRINYDGFCQAATEVLTHVGPAAGPYFQASTFLRFERDAAGAISLPLFMQYISLHAAGLRLRVQLAAYDESGTGVLNTAQLQRYLGSAATAAPLLSSMEAPFLPHYLHIAVRKLLLFHGRRGLQPSDQLLQQSSSSGGGTVVRISDLVSSSVMAELQELLMLGPSAEQERDLFSNWFSLQSTQRVLSTFNSWDLDGSGTLSRSEFSAISQGAMGELFIARVFEEHVAPQRGAAWPRKQQQSPTKAAAGGGGALSPSKLGTLPRMHTGGSPPRSPLNGSTAVNRSSLQQQQQGGSSSSANIWPPPLPPNAAGARDEMDLLAFADFVLAWDHRSHPAAVGYFFKIFDINHRVGKQVPFCVANLCHISVKHLTSLQCNSATISCMAIACCQYHGLCQVFILAQPCKTALARG